MPGTALRTNSVDSPQRASGPRRFPRLPHAGRGAARLTRREYRACAGDWSRGGPSAAIELPLCGYGLGTRAAALRSARAPSDRPIRASSPAAATAVPASSIPVGAPLSGRGGSVAPAACRVAAEGRTPAGFAAAPFGAPAAGDAAAARGRRVDGRGGADGAGRSRFVAAGEAGAGRTPPRLSLRRCGRARGRLESTSSGGLLGGSDGAIAHIMAHRRARMGRNSRSQRALPAAAPRAGAWAGRRDDDPSKMPQGRSSTA